LLKDERCRRSHTVHRLHALGERGRVRDAEAPGLEDEQVRVGGDDLVADTVLESGHHREDHDEGRDAEEHTPHPDPHEQR
jgi:hypothetical protein